MSSQFDIQRWCLQQLHTLHGDLLGSILFLDDVAAASLRSIIGADSLVNILGCVGVYDISESQRAFSSSHVWPNTGCDGLRATVLCGRFLDEVQPHLEKIAGYVGLSSLCILPSMSVSTHVRTEHVRYARYGDVL